MGFGMDIFISQIIGVVVAAALFVWFIMAGKKEIVGAPMDC